MDILIRSLKRKLFAFIGIYTFCLLFCLLSGGSLLFLTYILLNTRISPVTVIIGIGLTVSGLSLIFFLIKFLFKKNNNKKVGVYITKQEQPKVFELIREVCEGMNAAMPSKVMIVPGAEASVGPTSPFLSLFGSKAKVIHIGLGIVYAMNVDEVKAIIAHELGHTQQEEARLGSPIYYLMKIVHDITYADWLDAMIEEFETMHSFIYFILYLPKKLFHFINAVLHKRGYSIVLLYREISRILEFDADQQSVHIVGKDATCSALLKSAFAWYVFESVAEYVEIYGGGYLPSNIYDFFRLIYIRRAKIEGYALQNKQIIPDIRVYEKHLFELIYKVDWSTHPSLQERVGKLLGNSIDINVSTGPLGLDLITGSDEIEKRLHTLYLGSRGISTIDAKACNEEDLCAFADTRLYGYSNLIVCFKGYYTHRGPEYFLLDQVNTIESQDDFFSDEKAILGYQINRLHSIGDTLDDVNKEELMSIHYGGKKYLPDNIQTLKQEIIDSENHYLEEKRKNDERIYGYFRKIAQENGKEKEYDSLYRKYFSTKRKISAYYDSYNPIRGAIRFMFETMPVKKITPLLKELKEYEISFKNSISTLLDDTEYSRILLSQKREMFEKYLKSQGLYFYSSIGTYAEDELSLLIDVLDTYEMVVTSTPQHYFHEILKIQALCLNIEM